MESQFYQPPTHEPYMHAFTPQPFGWYSLCLPAKGWPGSVDLGGWSRTEIDVPNRELNPNTVTIPVLTGPDVW